MAKKEKKTKKEKKEKKSKKRGAERSEQPEIPYAGSDRVKTLLAFVLAILCGVELGLAIYTISRRAGSDAAARDGASAIAADAASAPGVGRIWFTQGDGTVIYW